MTFKVSTLRDLARALRAPDAVAVIDARLGVLETVEDGLIREIEKWRRTRELAVATAPSDTRALDEEHARYACGVDAEQEVTCEYCPDPDGCIDRASREEQAQ